MTTKKHIVHNVGHTHSTHKAHNHTTHSHHTHSHSHVAHSGHATHHTPKVKAHTQSTSTTHHTAVQVNENSHVGKNQVVPTSIKLQHENKMSAKAANMKKVEFAENTEGRLISKLSDEVLKNNPSNAIFNYTMNNFDRGYSQPMRLKYSSYYDCSSFAAAAQKDMIAEMKKFNKENGRVFDEKQLARTEHVFVAGSTTASQQSALLKNGIKPVVTNGSKAKSLFESVDKVGMVMYMRKPNGNQHVWISSRDPKTNGIVWSESFTYSINKNDPGVSIGTPAELFARNGRLADANRTYSLFDPYQGRNRKVLDALDEQNKNLTHAYKAAIKENGYEHVAYHKHQHNQNHQTDIAKLNTQEVFKELKEKLTNQSMEIVTGKVHKNNLT